MQLKNAHVKELSSCKAELEKPEMAEQLLKALAAMKKACEEELYLKRQKNIPAHSLPKVLSQKLGSQRWLYTRLTPGA